MKRRFSMGQALGAPFDLLKRRPGTLFAWGLVRVAAAIAIVALMWPLFSAVDWSAMDSETGPDMTGFARIEAGIQGLNLFSILLGLIVFNAAMRATLSRRGDGFAFLRLGMDELRVGVIWLAIGVALYLGFIVLILVGAALGFGVWTLGETIAIPVIVAYGGLVLLATFWAMARAALMVPVSMIQKTFAFESGWALGKGQATKLAVTAVLSWLILMVIQVAFIAVIALAGFALAAASGVDWAGLDWSGDWEPTAAEVQAMVQPLWPLLVFVIPAIFLAGFAQAMFAAPLASAARQLLDSGKTPTAIDPLDDGLSPIGPVTAAEADGISTGPDHDPVDGASDTHVAIADDPVQAPHYDGHPADPPNEPDADPQANHRDGH